MLRLILSKIVFFVKDYRAFFISLAWLFLMILFTYGFLLYALVDKNESFSRVYQNSFSLVSSIFLNFGIVVMTVFDLLNSEFGVSKGFLALILFLDVVIILIYAHLTQIASGNIISYLADPWLSYVFHVLFILGCLLLKYKMVDMQFKEVIPVVRGITIPIEF